MINYEPFGSLLENVVDNRGKTCPTADFGIPLIATNCISNDYLYPQFIKVRYVDDGTYKHWFRAHPKPGDMIFVLKGTPGRVSWAPDPVNFCIAQDMVAIRVNQEKVYPKYLFAALRSKTIQQQIERLHVGTLIPHFKKGDFDDLIIPILDPNLQRFIGNLYFNLSLKIDLLQRQNETLEALAQTLFRNMIIESDDYICEKWKTFLIGDKLEVLLGGTPSTRVNEYWDGNIPWINSGEINQFRILSPTRYITQTGFDNSSTKLLPAKTTVIAITGATLGQVSRLEIDSCANQSVIGILSSDEFSNEYIYLWIQHFIKEIIAKQTGGAQQHINTTDIRETCIIKPDNQTRKELLFQIEPLFEKISKNSFQIQTLGKLRDTLLPKLMSGEVQVQ